MAAIRGVLARAGAGLAAGAAMMIPGLAQAKPKPEAHKTPAAVSQTVQKSKSFTKDVKYKGNDKEFGKFLSEFKKKYPERYEYLITHKDIIVRRIESDYSELLENIKTKKLDKLHFDY